MQQDNPMPSPETDPSPTLGGGIYAELAGEGRVEIDPAPGPGPVPTGHISVLGTYDGFRIRVDRPNYTHSIEEQEYTETYRVPTECGTFEVSHTIDRTGESWTHSVAVEAVATPERSASD